MIKFEIMALIMRKESQFEGDAFTVAAKLAACLEPLSERLQDDELAELIQIGGAIYRLGLDQCKQSVPLENIFLAYKNSLGLECHRGKWKPVHFTVMDAQKMEPSLQASAISESLAVSTQTDTSNHFHRSNGSGWPYEQWREQWRWMQSRKKTFKDIVVIKSENFFTSWFWLITPRSLSIKNIDTAPLGNASLALRVFAQNNLAQNNQLAAPDERRIMDQEEILTFIMEVETEDIDPVCVAKVYAAAVDDIQSRISAQDMRRLLLIGAAMFRSSIKGKHVELQLPTSSGNEDGRDILENEPFKGILH